LYYIVIGIFNLRMQCSHVMLAGNVRTQNRIIELPKGFDVITCDEMRSFSQAFKQLFDKIINTGPSDGCDGGMLARNLNFVQRAQPLPIVPGAMRAVRGIGKACPHRRATAPRQCTR
jgi:hypothetical protein